MSNLDAILAAAKSQATALTPVDTGAPAAGMPAPLSSGGGAMTAYNMSMDAFLNPGGMECATYIQVKDSGIKLNKDWVGTVDEFEAIMTLSEVQFFMGIRKEVGTNVSYAKSYDGQTEARSGEPFAQVVEKFKRESQKPADIYRGADVPLTLVSSLEDPRKGSTAKGYGEGDVVGLTTSITGFKPFAAFAKKLQQAGLANTPVKVKVTHSPRKNAANQAYGVCEFDVIEVLQGSNALAA